ncbi:MAG: DNA adenine methylase [Chthoniobacterales bacterium]
MVSPTREFENLPLLKWPGGKRWLSPRLTQMLERVEFNRYYEPFCGGAALFFRLAPKSAILSDTNIELINCYQQIRDAPNAVIAALTRHKNTEAGYYAVRNTRPRNPATRAARIVYLTTLSPTQPRELRYVALQMFFGSVKKWRASVRPSLRRDRRGQIAADTAASTGTLEMLKG